MTFGRSSTQRVMETLGEKAGQAQRIVGEHAERAQQMVPATTTLLDTFEQLPPGVYLAAMAASVAASMALMFAGRERGRHWSLFLGLWAPTILNLGLYSRLRRGC
jgi:hypothetical protein